MEAAMTKGFFYPRTETGRSSLIPRITGESAGSGFVNGHPMAHHRVIPGIAKGSPDAFAELIASGAASVEAGQAWTGEATLDLFDAPTEELASLEAREIIGGYYRQVGVVWDGGRTLTTL
jgi:hypothetical protein